MQKCKNFPRSLCSLAYYRLYQCVWFAGSLWGVYSVLSLVGKLHRCNKLTDKHVILCRYSQIKFVKRFCPSESVLARLFVNVYFLTFWVDNFPNISPKVCTRLLNFNSEKAKTPWSGRGAPPPIPSPRTGASRPRLRCPIRLLIILYKRTP